MTPQKWSGFQIVLITIGCFLSFFIFGFLDNIKGPALPLLLTDLHFNYSDGGIVLFGEYAGFLCATLITGFLSGRLGRKNILVYAMLLLTVGILGFAFFRPILLLLFFIFLIGFGLGAIEVGANALIVQVHRKHPGGFLNLLAFFHGLGGMTAPLFASQLFIHGHGWQLPYQLTIVLTVIAATLLLFTRSSESRDHEQFTFSDIKIVAKRFFSLDVIPFNCIICLYVMAEIGFAAWVVDYLQKIKLFTPELGSLFLALFFVGLTLGRFVGTFLVDLIGHVRVMLIAGIASMVCLGIGIFGPPVCALFLPATGLFFSVIFPTTTAAFMSRNTENPVILMSLMFAFAGIGGMIGPWLIGIAGNVSGIGSGFMLVLLFAVIMSGIAGFVLVRDNRKQRRA